MAGSPPMRRSRTTGSGTPTSPPGTTSDRPAGRRQPPGPRAGLTGSPGGFDSRPVHSPSTTTQEAGRKIDMELTARKLDLIEKALRLAVLLVDKPDADPAEV